MEFTYENQGISTYLCCELTDMEIDTMGLGMITNNHIPGFVPSAFTQMNGRKFMKYNVSSKVSMKQFFSGQVNRKRLVSVFAGIADLLMQAEEYMLDVNSIILDTDYIFISVPDCAAEVIYVPAVFQAGSSQEVAMFFKNIMFSTQFDSSENCDYVAEIINFLNQAGVFAIPQFKKLLEKLKQQPRERSMAAGTVYGSEGMGTVKNRNMPSGANMVENRIMSGRTADNAAETGNIPDNGADSQMGTQQPVLAIKPESPQMPVSGAAQRPAPGAPIPQMPIPGGNKVPDMPQKANGAVKQESPEKQISLFYLLQHYNKENAELYKAQKEGQKQKSGELSENKPKTKNKKEKQPKEKRQKSKKADVTVNYAVPGQQSVPVVPEQPVIQASPSRQIPSAPPREEKLSAVLTAEQNSVSDNNFGETEYMSPADDGGTVLMGDGGMQEMQPYLIRLKNNERIPLDRGVLSIGRNKELVDYAIPDNRFVGHYHCHILSREGEFFIVDDNSKNHTYVSGTEIQSNTEIKLSHNTIFSVANEEFEVRLF